MSIDRDTTLIIRAWLQTDEHESADRVLDAVIDALDATPQRRSLPWPIRRLPELNRAAQVAIGVAAAILVVVVGVQLFAPGGARMGGPTESAPAPTVTPAPRPLTSWMAPLEPGRYALADGFPVDMTFDVGPGWSSCSLGTVEQGICYQTTTRESNMGVSFLIVENVVADPCDSSSLPDPPIGPSVDDLVTAISSMPGFEASAREPTTVGGFPATRFTVTAPAQPGCGLATWATRDRTNGVGPGEVNDLYIVDVEGVRVLISSAWSPLLVTDDAIAARDAVIASIEIEP